MPTQELIGGGSLPTVSRGQSWEWHYWVQSDHKICNHCKLPRDLKCQILISYILQPHTHWPERKTWSKDPIYATIVVHSSETTNQHWKGVNKKWKKITCGEDTNQWCLNSMCHQVSTHSCLFLQYPNQTKSLWNWTETNPKRTPWVHLVSDHHHPHHKNQRRSCHDYNPLTSYAPNSGCRWSI